MTRYSIEPRTRKYIKEYWSVSFSRNLSDKYVKQSLGTATKTGLDGLQTASKKVVHKAAEATGEIIESKIPDKVVKPKNFPGDNSGSLEEIVIPPKKRQELRQVLKNGIQ